MPNAPNSYTPVNPDYTTVTKTSDRGSDEMFAFRTDEAVIVIMPANGDGGMDRMPE